MQGGAIALPAPSHTPLAHRLGAISESRSLDRLLRSRGWIALLGILLIGLVFMQVSLLKLNAGMGADVERSAALERGNAMMQAEVSKLESNDRIQQKALESGMVLPPSDNVRYLGNDGKRIGGAAAAAMPSQGEASTALLPTLPATSTPDGVTAPTTDTTGTTAAAPQTTSSVPNAAQAAAQAQVDAAAQQAAAAAAAAAATPAPVVADTTAAATTGAVAATQTTTPPAAAAAAPTTAATGAATVGGVTPGG